MNTQAYAILSEIVDECHNRILLSIRKNDYAREQYANGEITATQRLDKCSQGIAAINELQYIMEYVIEKQKGVM